MENDVEIRQLKKEIRKLKRENMRLQAECDELSRMLDQSAKMQTHVQKQLIIAEEDKYCFICPNAKLLVVDDVSMNLKVVEGLLEDTEVQIDTATNGRMALKLIEQNPYDIIFLDHLMPELDGVETLAEMKNMALQHNQNTPVIMLTANEILGAKDQYMQAGFTDYITKPLQKNSLKKALKNYLDSSLIIELEDNMEKTSEETPQKASQKMPEEGAEQVVSNETGPIEKIGFMDYLRDIPQLDVEKGVFYCLKSEDFYKEMLQEYLIDDKTEDLNQYFEANDFENYQIKIHSLKGISATIGATKLSEDAKLLEFACKDEDIDYVKKHHREVIEKYQSLLAKLRLVMDNDIE